MSRALVSLVLLAVLAGCGASTTTPPAARESSACRVLARAAVDDARELLRDYNGNPSPADLPFYDLRETLANVQSRCLPRSVGAALTAALGPQRRATLYSLLPATYVAYLRLAVSCTASENDGDRCTTLRRSIHSPGATGTGKTPHPVVP